MDCTKTTQLTNGAWVFKKCSCTKCQVRKQAIKAFWDRFDSLYNNHIGQAAILETIGVKK
ncbi:hypothetical protein [Gottfriedia acidiceleris]|uniref:hypothetical protein n=1 Tax=Gottfriedia acidiceleris TaxID=371036 RepID=UPI00101CDE6A|nr:hypothetical protein [Gottfriedia acidiceleris]